MACYPSIDWLIRTKPALVLWLGFDKDFTKWELHRPSRNLYTIVADPDLSRIPVLQAGIEVIGDYDTKEMWELCDLTNPLYRELKVVVSEKAQLSPEWYKGVLRDFLEMQTRVAKAYGNSINDNFRGLDNTISNLGFILGSPQSFHIKSLWNIAQGKKVACVGAGPSLGDHLDTLSDMQDCGIPIIAADTALRPLWNHGIVPEVVCTMERHEATHHFFRLSELFQTVAQDKQSVLVAPPVIPPATAVMWKGPVVWAPPLHSSVSVWLEEAYEGWEFHHGRSSGTMTFQIARFMGAKDVHLFGLDFCWEDDGTTHVGGTAYDEGKVGRPQAVRAVTRHDGTVAPTNTFFLDFWKELEVSVARSNVGAIYNHSTGVPIAGTVRASMEQSVVNKEAGWRQKRVEPHFEPLQVDVRELACRVEEWKSALREFPNPPTTTTMEEAAKKRETLMSSTTTANRILSALVLPLHASFERSINQFTRLFSDDDEMKERVVYAHQAFFNCVGEVKDQLENRLETAKDVLAKLEATHCFKSAAGCQEYQDNPHPVQTSQRGSNGGNE